jgi:hypothetical protein
VKLTPHTILFGQTRALENLSAVLAAAGSGLEHVLKANVYLANMPRDFAAMNEAYIKVGNIKFAPCSAQPMSPILIGLHFIIIRSFTLRARTFPTRFSWLVAWAQPSLVSTRSGRHSW